VVGDRAPWSLPPLRSPVDTTRLCIGRCASLQAKAMVSNQPWISPAKLQVAEECWRRTLQPWSIVSAHRRVGQHPEALGAARVAAIGGKACRDRACRVRSTIAGIDKGRRGPFFLGISIRGKGPGRERGQRPMRSTAWACFAGVSQRAPSTPGLCCPVCSVTRLTAKARAAHACPNRERRRLTGRQAPAWTAWTIRRGRDRPRRWPAAPWLRCQALLVRSEDACRAGLRRVHSASGRGLPRRSRPSTPVGSQPPCGVGQRLTPSPPHDRVACASSHVPDRLRRPLGSRAGDSGGLRPGTASESDAGCPRLARCTTKAGEDASVPREGQRGRRLAVHTHRPALRALVALGPDGGSRPARVTMRHTEASVPFSFPTLARRCAHVPLTAHRCIECLRPHRCQRRPLASGTGGTTPG
jgi:hypothetical protein